ncbi:unnamed protein product [Lactuca saligna]|uniref:Uncharacterized protein n=1 Tax=Lactuca saligna TaxID=75948 RepID=A0AA35UVV3_LACSI|nr:unnamed protein product [Lactuca saligna]
MKNPRNQLMNLRGEYEQKRNPKSKDTKGNEASGSKGKGKLDDDDEEEEEDLSKGSHLKRKKCEQELVENLQALFPHRSMEHILNEAIDNLNVYWLEAVASFELENTSESQLDFPLTLKAFLFRCFYKVEKAPDSDNDPNLMLISFYLKHRKPQI